MIKLGEVAFVKTTNEPVFVLELRKVSENWQNLILDNSVFSGLGAIVRIPAMTESKGVTHHITTFLVEELETEADRETREESRRQRELDTIERLNEEARRRSEKVAPPALPKVN